MQAYCIGVDPTLTEDEPRRRSANGWRCPRAGRSAPAILDEELVVDTTATIATVLQDELENTYTLPG